MMTELVRGAVERLDNRVDTERRIGCSGSGAAFLSGGVLNDEYQYTIVREIELNCDLTYAVSRIKSISASVLRFARRP